jgi:hypothetical protein
MLRRWERNGNVDATPMPAAAACAAHEQQPVADENDSLPGEFRFVPDGERVIVAAHWKSGFSALSSPNRTHRTVMLLRCGWMRG